MSVVAIRPRELEIVTGILHVTLPAEARAWVFGTRARGTPRRASDLDIAVDAGRPLTRIESAALNTAFDDSDLPYKVDLVDWRAADPAFRAIIERDRVALELENDAGDGSAV
jgi:predicted nucleotidyltransferase